MQQFPTRTSSNTPLLIAALGVGALAAYALSSPRRRAAVAAAGRSAVDAGSRLATTSAERLRDAMPEAARDSVSRFTAKARSTSDSVTAATAGRLHDVADRATELMHEVVARARRRRADAMSDVHEPADERAEGGAAGRSSARGVMIAAAAVGAGLYAMQRYGASDRVRHKLGADDSGTIRLERTLFIDAPIEQVFDTWADLENFPRFMSNVESVRPLEGNRSHWKVRGPAGVGVEFDSVTRKQRPNELSWASEPGSTVQNEGRVTLVPEASGTRATVRMSYRPPAGAWGHAVSSLLGANPKQEFEDDLNRMKQFIEGRRAVAPQAV